MGREDTEGEVPAPHLGALGGEEENLRASWTATGRERATVQAIKIRIRRGALCGAHRAS
jgi:hypothetical protein